MPRLLSATPLLLALTLLAGCDLFGGDNAEKVAAAREADGKAIGGACRHAGRAIEDCYALNRKADKASVFAGWRDMNDYMRENKIEAVAPQLPTQVANAKQADTKGEAKADAHAEAKTVTDVPAADVADKRPAKAGAKPREAKPHDS